MQAAIDYLRDNSGRDGVDELVILRDGRCVFEGSRVANVHGIWSATKSFISTLAGILQDDGAFCIDDPVCRAVPELSADYHILTFRHFLTMTSGYRAIGDDKTMGDYKHGPSLTPLTPAAPAFAAGTAYEYWDSAMNMLAYALTCVAGKPLVDLLRERLAGPLEMRVQWGEIQHDGKRSGGGAGNHDKHIMLCAHDLAKFGQLFLQQGTWAGRRIISEAWCREATRCHVPSTLPCRGSIHGPGHYGLNWWMNTESPDAQPKWPGAPADTYSASGYNNNDLFVIPSRGLVVARMGLDQQTDGAISDEVYGRFLAMLG